MYESYIKLMIIIGFAPISKTKDFVLPFQNIGPWLWFFGLAVVKVIVFYGYGFR